MTVTKEVFVDLNEKYNKFIKLISEDSKLDPENEPFKSKYSARDILLGMKENLEKIMKKQLTDENQQLKLTAMLGTVHLYLGMISIDVEELSTGEENLNKCFELINNYLSNSEVIMITLNMYNQFGILWSQREPEKAKSYLVKAQELYLNYKKTTTPPLDISDLFNPNVEHSNPDVAWKNFENIYTFTLYYLAQVYGTLKDVLKSSVYCHVTLQRQLDSKEYDPIDWALNAATLSQFFMEKNGFKQARHHLAASSYILNKYEEELTQNPEQSDAYDAKMETFKHRSADVARCWAKYGLLLLSKSKERLLHHTENIDEVCTLSTDLSTLTLEPDSTITASDLQNLEFTSLNLTEYEKQITCKFVLTIQDARLVFLNIQGWLQKAETYYKLETLASDHIEIVQDKTQMYLNLLFFEDSPETQAKLHKRRIDLLENIIKKVNPQYYLSYCRQIWFELGQTYSDILNIKSDKLKELNDRPSPQMLLKINHLIDMSISNFKHFIESFKEVSMNTLPAKIPDDYEKAFLQAFFHIGALNSRYITLDKNIQLANVEASYETYKKIFEYCQKNENAKALIAAEIGICKEMIGLLPIKMAKLRQELSA